MSDKHDDNKKHEKGHGRRHKSHGPGGHGGDHEEEHGCPEWVMSFADNTALMMGFFVIMLALAMGTKGVSNADTPSDPTKTATASDTASLDFVIGVREAFNNPVDLDTSDPDEMRLVQRIKERFGQENNPQAGPKGDATNLESLRPSDYAATATQVRFHLNATRLDPDAVAKVHDAAHYLKGLRLVVQVRGHASAQEAYMDPQRAWKISFDRALAVAHELNVAGIEWERMRIVACGATERSRDGADVVKSDAMNQRVEVIELNDTLAESRVPAAP